MSDSVLMVEADQIERFARALASPARRRILELVHERALNVNELSAQTGLSQSATVTHVQALEQAGLLTSRSVPARKGAQKVCRSRLESAVVLFGEQNDRRADDRIVREMPIGLFFEHEVHPTCGMATENGYVGYVDSPESFLDPHRSSAQLLWFERGYVEYRLPVPAFAFSRLESLSVSAEVCSEFPGHNPEWPSDITVWINGVEVGTYRCPGDMGDRRGHLTPEWWSARNSQYGFLKEWRVNREGSFVDGVHASETTLDELHLDPSRTVSVRIGIRDDAEFRGGLNLFGNRFGNYPQDIRLTAELASQGSDR